MSPTPVEDCGECDGRGEVPSYEPIGMDPYDGYVFERETWSPCERCGGTGGVPAEEPPEDLRG